MPWSAATMGRKRITIAKKMTQPIAARILRSFERTSMFSQMTSFGAGAGAAFQYSSSKERRPVVVTDCVSRVRAVTNAAEESCMGWVCSESLGAH